MVIEGPTEALHDELCRIKGSFRQTLVGVKALQDVGLPIQSKTTNLQKNLDILTQMPAFGRSIGLTRMAFNLFIPTKRRPQNDALFVAYSEIPPVIDGIRKACHAADVEFLWYSPMPMYIYNTLARGLGNKNCAACDGLISVSPNGDVLPCSPWDESVENLLTDGFEKTWFSKRVQCIKNEGYASPECQSCGAFAACQSACPLYWNDRGSEELERLGPSFRARYTKRPIPKS